MASAAMLSMGNANVGCGVCGVTSSFYAMWTLNKSARARLMNAPLPFSVLAEIKTYLRMLQGAGETKAIEDIETFCKSFGPPFDTFNVNVYCDRISASVTKSAIHITEYGLFGIGIPPLCVADYLSRIWECVSSVIEVPREGSDPRGDAIIGMIVPESTRDPGNAVVKTGYNRRLHYMYRHNQLIYSWGSEFASIEEAAEKGAPWAIGW